jgi:multiple sugar transport system substrate-binding protein
MKRSIAAGVALGAAVLLTVSACSSSKKSSGTGGTSGGSSGAAVTLNFVGADYGTGPANSTQKYWEGIASDFHAANPNITVKVQTINWNDFDNRVKTMVQNKQYPDVMEGDYFPDYAQSGLLYAAKDVTSPNTFSNLLSVFAKLNTYKGTQYGMPFTTSARTLFYNKKIFQQAGITSAPQTWDQIQADATKIKSATGKVGFGLPLGSEEAQAESLLWFLGNGGGYQDDSGNWTINSPQNAEALTFMSGMVKAGVTEPNPGTKNRTDLWKQFAQGGIGMINGSPALIPIIQDGGKLQASDWASVPIAGKSGALDKTLGVCDNVSVFKTDSSKQDAQKKFVDFFYQDKYQIQFDKEYALLPATNSAIQSLSSDPTFGPFLKALPNSVQYPNDPIWSTVKTQIQQQIGLAMSQDPKKILDSIQQTAEKGS